MKAFRYTLFILVLIPGLLFSQMNDVKSTNALIEVKSKVSSQEYDFEICLVFSEQSNDEPLRVEKKTTPFRLETESHIIVAIIKCKDYEHIQSSLTTFDKNDKKLGFTSGSAFTFILHKRGDLIEFSSIN